jgi:hypothetical protein
MTMMATPAIFASKGKLSRSTWPAAEAVAPSNVKTVEKPRTKTKPVSKTVQRCFLVSGFSADVRSSSDTPEM